MHTAERVRRPEQYTIHFLTQDELRQLFKVIGSKRANAIFLMAYRHRPTVFPLMIPLVYSYIKSFQRVSSVEKPLPGGEKRRGGWAAYPVAW